MTIWEKICGEVSDKIELLIEKNRVAAVKNRLKLTLARENKQLERVYMQIGRACFAGRRMSEDPQMADFYGQAEELIQKIQRLQNALETVETREDNVISVDFGGAAQEENAAEGQPVEQPAAPECRQDESSKPEGPREDPIVDP